MLQTPLLLALLGLARADAQELGKVKAHADNIYSLALSPDGRWLATASADNTCTLWHYPELKRKLTIEHDAPVYEAAFSPDGKLLATASGDRAATLWDAATGKQVHRLATHTGPVYCVAFSPDGKRLATGSGDDDFSCKLWDTATGRELLTLKGHTRVSTGPRLPPAVGAKRPFFSSASSRVLPRPAAPSIPGSMIARPCLPRVRSIRIS